ncbi:MAG: NifU family protein [Planctomycetes bacterium]|nr:NifU family protein [Planctomycetota bacterium]
MNWLARILGRARAESAPPAGDPARVAEVERVLAQCAPALALDGGAVELVAVEGDDVVLRWSGACRSCSAQHETLSGGIEPWLRRDLAWLGRVRVTT